MKANFGEQTLESMNQADWYNQWTMNKFKNFLNGKILEVGCGIGNFTKSLLVFGQIFGIDIRSDYVEKTKKMLEGQNVHIGLGNIENGKYFFKDEKFDSIVCINVLEHIEKDSQAIRNIYQILNKEGALILLVPSFPFLYGEIDKAIGHFRRYTKEEIKDKLKAENFTIVRFKTINLVGALGWFISGKLLKNKLIDPSKIKLFNLFAPLFLRLEDLVEPPFGTSFLVIAKKI